MKREYRFSDGREYRYRIVAKLRREGLDNDEIAEVLGVSLATVRSAVQNARRFGLDVPRLRKVYERRAA